LGIEIDEQDTATGLRKRYREVDCSRRFADAALLIGDCYYPPHIQPRTTEERPQKAVSRETDAINLRERYGKSNFASASAGISAI
jgi:hypothetical protein